MRDMSKVDREEVQGIGSGETGKEGAANTDPRLEKMTLSSLLKMAHKRNPKEHSIGHLIGSFKRFGFVAYPTIDEKTETMVAGHGRCLALAQLRNGGEPPPRGVDEVGTEWWVPVIRGISFENERERDAYLLADNQQNLAAGWNLDLLSEMVATLRDDGGLEGLGFEQVEIDSLLGQAVPDFPGDNPGSTSSNAPSDEHGRTQITARIECPNCKHVFER